MRCLSFLEIMNKNNQIIIINFSDIYRQQHFYKELKENNQEDFIWDFVWIEAADMEGCNCYCDDMAAEMIREKIVPYEPTGIHFLDSGNYHYMSRFWLEKIQMPFRLLVFDNHTDMQPPAFGGLLSCGGWIRAALEELPLLKEVILIGPDQEAFDQTESELREKVRFLSREKLAEMDEEVCRTFGDSVPEDLPLYISVDKDVLNTKEASTTWSQGDMTLEELMCWLSWFSKRENVIGMDVCGESDPDTAEKDYLNDQANRQILEFWMEGRKKL